MMGLIELLLVINKMRYGLLQGWAIEGETEIQNLPLSRTIAELPPVACFGNAALSVDDDSLKMTPI